MHKKLAVLALFALISGCYTTRIASGDASFDNIPESQVHSHRQWFTVGGLARLSEPAGRECRHGLATAQSGRTFTDWLISAGVAVVGGTASWAACKDKDSDTQATCFTAGATLASFLIDSRTVEYTCLDSGVPEVPQLPLLPSSPNLAPPPSAR